MVSLTVDSSAAVKLLALSFLVKISREQVELTRFTLFLVINWTTDRTTNAIGTNAPLVGVVDSRVLSGYRVR